MNCHDEAMGLIAAFVNRLPACRDYWALALGTSNAALEHRQQSGPDGKTIRVPKIGSHHFVSIR
jgi:hypothetical protein